MMILEYRDEQGRHVRWAIVDNRPDASPPRVWSCVVEDRGYAGAGVDADPSSAYAGALRHLKGIRDEPRRVAP